MKSLRCSFPTALAVSLLFSFAMNLRAQDFAPSVPAARLGSTVFRWEDLVAKSSGVGERRDVTQNPTVTLAEFECHLSTLNAGLASHPPHRHPQEELIVLKEGTLEVF